MGDVPHVAVPKHHQSRVLALAGRGEGTSDLQGIRWFATRLRHRFEFFLREFPRDVLSFGNLSQSIEQPVHVLPRKQGLAKAPREDGDAESKCSHCRA